MNVENPVRHAIQRAMGYSRQAAQDDDDDDIGELQVSEYLIYLLALDTYMRYVEEATGEDPRDEVTANGLRLLRLSDAMLSESLTKFLDENLPTKSHKKMLARAMQIRVSTPMGAARRSLQLRTLLSRGGATTQRAIFKTNRALRQVREAISASMMDDADAALDKFAALQMRNSRIRGWIDLAAKTAVQREIPKNAIEAGSKESVDQASEILNQQVQSAGGSGAEEVEEAKTKQSDVLTQVEQEATSAARKALEASGEADIPPTKSEVIGLAVAAATAALGDPSKPQNVPDPLRGLDDEQRAAALTDGRVLVAAGAGAGKCVRGDTLVRTPRGLVPIGEFAAHLEADQEGSCQETVLGLSGPEQTSTILHNGRRGTIRLTTRMGYQLEGTPNHPIWVLRDGEHQWVQLGDLDLSSDYVCIDRRPGMWAEGPYQVENRVFTKRTSAEPTNIPTELTPQVAALLGYIISEGYVVYGWHSQVSLSTTGKSQLALYQQACDGLVKYSVGHYAPSGGGTSDRYVVRFGCRSNLEALADFGLTYTRAHEKEVPVGIFRSPKPVVVSFLRSLFDGDGWFYRTEIGYASASEKLARGVQILLLNFGILASLRFKPNPKRGAWVVTLTGDNARQFLSEVGFNLQEKQTAALSYFSATESNPNLDIVPGLSGLFEAVLFAAKKQGLKPTTHPKYHAFKCYRMGTRNPSRKLIKEFLEAYPESSALEDISKLAEFQKSVWFYDTIETMEPSHSEVFDFVVPGTHSFSAGGFVNHNSTTVVARVEYLVKERRILPSRVLVTSFNTKAANDLKQKIGSSVGGDALNQMSVGTMHSLFRKFIGEYGTPQEQSAMGVGKAKGGFIQGGGAVARTVQRLWAECFPEGSKDEKEVPKLKNVLQFKSKWSGNNITPADARAQAKTRKEADAALWYEYYEGLKGSIPGWQPPCKGKAYESFMARWRPNDERLGDFDDMLTIFRDILKREPMVRKALQKMFDHLLVDEAQDLSGVQFDIISMMSEHITDGKDGKSLWICGDDKQCPSSDTDISTPRGLVKAKDLRSGDEVLSWRNGKIVPQVVTVGQSEWSWGYKLTTESGKALTISPSHKIWATSPELEPNQVAVYLMFRADMGFRVGLTNKGRKGADYLGSLAGRAFQEKAEKMWILSVHEDREQAKLEETSVSLTYGIPTMVFNGVHRGLNQNRIEDTFRRFGRNGMKLLEERFMSLDLPHWVSKGYAKYGCDRRVVQLLAHTVRNSLVRLEWSLDTEGNNPLKEALEGISYEATARGRYRLRREFSSYREAQAFAVALARKTNSILNHTLSTPEGTLQKVTASILLPGMSVPVLDGDTLALEGVISVEKVDADFTSVEVDDASNFIGGGILSHNSIYSFRGARPDLFTKLATTEGWTTKMIRTNYRCQPEIVDAANKLIAFNEDQIPMEAVPSPSKSRGVASIDVATPSDEADAALSVVEGIKSNISVGEDVASHSILCRTNKELHSYETACIIRGIPYARKGASSFLGSPETKTVLGYVQLVTGDDSQKMQAALADVINKPNRFFVAPDAGTKAVTDALSEYARGTGQDIKTLNPLAAIGDPSFQISLAQKLTRQRSGFKFEKTVEKIEEMAGALSEMQALSQEPGFTTKDLFDNILSLSGTVAVTGPDGRARFIEQSLRDSLKAEMRDSVDDDDSTDDDDDDDDSKGLGNVAFLFKVAEPDPTDPDDLMDPPTSPAGFKAKMERYAAKARELRIDITAWEKKQATLSPEKRSPPPGAYLGTVHSVKGAQWKNCYVQMPAGKFPFIPPVKPGEPPPPPEEMQEQMESERRLAYVALTRAAVNLTVVCPDVVGGKPAGVSPFVSEAGLKVGENVPKPGAPNPPIDESPEVQGEKTASKDYEGLLPEGWE